MKAGILFTGTGPLLILTSCASLHEPILLHKLEAKGLAKFIIHEIDFEKVRRQYGVKYNIVMGNLHETDVLRVLDYDGQHIFTQFSMDDLGEPMKFDLKQMVGQF